MVGNRVVGRWRHGRFETCFDWLKLRVIQRKKLININTTMAVMMSTTACEICRTRTLSDLTTRFSWPQAQQLVTTAFMTQAAQVSANYHGAKFSILYQFYTNEHFCRARRELQYLSLSLSLSGYFSCSLLILSLPSKKRLSTNKEKKLRNHGWKALERICCFQKLRCRFL